MQSHSGMESNYLSTVRVFFAYMSNICQSEYCMVTLLHMLQRPFGKLYFGPSARNIIFFWYILGKEERTRTKRILTLHHNHLRERERDREKKIPKIESFFWVFGALFFTLFSFFFLDTCLERLKNVAVGSNKGRRGFFEVGKNSGKTKSGMERLQRTRRGYAQGPAAQLWI